MNLKEIENSIKNLITELTYNIKLDDIGENDLLFGNKLGFDSVKVLNLLLLLEDRFDIIIEDEELRIDLFDSVKSVILFIDEKLNKHNNIEYEQ